MPWYTIFDMCISAENLPPTATRAFRAASQDFETARISSGTPLACSLRNNLLELTLSKAPDTSEQYTAFFYFFPNCNSHAITRCANASLAPRSGMYANWLRPYASLQISWGTKIEASTRSATLLICDVTWIPL